MYPPITSGVQSSWGNCDIPEGECLLGGGGGGGGGAHETLNICSLCPVSQVELLVSSSHWLMLWLWLYVVGFAETVTNLLQVLSLHNMLMHACTPVYVNYM